MSTLAAVGLAVASMSGIPAVLRVWGVWAIVAGLLQLVLAVHRRQWPLVLSGGLSVLAGAALLVMDGPRLTGIAGYAALGGLFFLASAVRSGRRAE